MWVMTEEGALAPITNRTVTVNGKTLFTGEKVGEAVIAWRPLGEFGEDVDVLCSCDDVEHGKEIVEQIGFAMELVTQNESEGPVIYVDQVKSMVEARRVACHIRRGTTGLETLNQPH